VIGRIRLLAAVLLVTGCGDGPREDIETSVSPTSVSVGSTVDTTGGSSGSESGTIDDVEKLDTPEPGAPGCEAIDFLFVIDNSESMATYQQRLAEQFPDFITAMFDAVPAGISVHVGLTTTDFDNGCDTSEATQNCQSTATLDEVEMHYQRPDIANDGGNGTQGRLFEYATRTYFETSSDDDPAELSQWFGEAAVAAGEDGCSFEMPVASAGFVAHPANDDTNAGFIRDAGALLVVFVLTDEPDKSPESRFVYEEMLLATKQQCGGAECIFVSGLFPGCTLDVNQKLWQFLNLFDDEPPLWGDIDLTTDYTEVFGDALANAIAQACENLPEG
jgi:hypothetical protein